MNPLLNRLYQTKTRHNSVRVSGKRAQSSYDKQLVPKMNTKKLIEDVPFEKKQERKKTIILKSNTPKLPAINNQPKNPSLYDFSQAQKVTQKSFRQRKLSSRVHDRQQIATYFPTQLNLQEHLDSKHSLQFKQETAKKVQEFKRQTVIRFNDLNQQGQQDEVFQYLQVLQNNEDLAQQFCYMNRGQLPYSYYIIEYEQRNPDQYLTVSLRGITQIKGQQNQFFPIKSLKREIQKYRQLKQINFFKNYIKTKVFKHWSHKTAMKKFQEKCKYIETNLFQQNPSIQPYLSFLHSTVQDFNTSRLIAENIRVTLTLQGFVKILHNSSRKIVNTIHFYEQKIEKQLKEGISTALTKFRQEKRVTLGTNQKQQESFLPYDSKKKDMKYTQMAKLKQFQGYMFKIVKYTDMLRFNTKAELILDGLRNYYNMFDWIYTTYLRKSSLTFVPWIHVTVQLTSRNPQLSQIVCKPSLEEIKVVLDRHRIETVLSIIKAHKLWINRKQQFHCEQYELPGDQQQPVREDLKYYLQREPKFIRAMEHITSSLQILIGVPTYHMETTGKTILDIYKDSVLHNIDDYMTNQKLKGYLSKYAYQRECLSKAEGQIQMGLVLMNITQPIKQAKLRYQDKFKKITVALPQEVLRRCQHVVAEVKIVYNEFKENPSSIREYLLFRKKYKFYKPKLDELQNMIEGLLELEQMTYTNGIRIGEVPKLHIQQANTYYKELLKRFEQIADNQQDNKKKFESNVQNLIPKLQQDSQQLYNDIYADKMITSPNIPVKNAQQKLFNTFGVRFDALKQRKQELFYFQEEFELGHNELQNYFKLELNIEWFFKLWTGRQKYEQYLKNIQQKGYVQLLDLDTKALQFFIKDIQNATSDLQAVQLMQEFKQDALRVQRVIRICKFMASQTLQQQHKNKIKELLFVNSDMENSDKNFKNDIFSGHSGRTVTGKRLVESTNILDIQKQLQEIVFTSAQQSIIKKKLGQMEEYWKKVRIRIMNSDASQSGAQIPHLDHSANEQFHEKLGAFLLTLKNIQGSSHNSGVVAQKVSQQLTICKYLRNLLWKWEEVQAGWLKLLPLMTNCPSIKHQSNVYFQFTSLDNTIKKINRQVQQMPSIKKIIEDVQQGKYLNTFVKCGKELVQINKTFQLFLEAKRQTYSRFCFLADHELITVLQKVRDVHSFAKYAGLCFNCQKIATEKDLVCGFENSLQFFKLRKTLLRGQTQQMFKTIEENMRGSLKIMVAAMIPKVKIKQNLAQQFKDYPLQVMMIVDKIIWTENTQNYLQVSSYDDYLLLLKRPFQQLLDFLTKSDKKLWVRIATRVTQCLALKQIGEQLIRDQVTRSDFKWKEQLKYSTQDQQLCISQFDRKMHYGYEYYPPNTAILVPTQTTYKLMHKCFGACSTGNKVLLVQGEQGQGKGFLVNQMAALFGCFRKTLICNQNISMQYIMRFIQGAMSAACWLTFYQFDQLSHDVLGKMLESVSRLQINQKCHPRTLFNLVHHGEYAQRVSIYSFKNLVVVQPEKKKICEWLLKIYKFRQVQVLSYKLLDFLETVTPFLQKILGGPVSLLRRILLKAGQIKLESDPAVRDENILSQVIQREIIIKSEIKTRAYLRKALLSYFQYEQNQNSTEFVNKLLQTESKLKQLMKDVHAQKILLVGNRSCKSLILQRYLEGRQTMKIYPQAVDQFFTAATIQKINNLPSETIIIYDANQVMRQWNDLLTASQIYIEGEKITLKNKIVLELRNLQSATPSMVGNCKILYTGDVFTKEQKIKIYLELEQKSNFMEILHQLYNDDLHKLKETHIETLCKFVKPFAKSNNRNLQKIIIWIMTLIDDQNLWSKFYNGSPYDFYIHEAYQELATVERGKYEMIHYPDNSDYLIVPTKNIIVTYELIINFFAKDICTLVVGPQFSGKSSLFHMFKSPHHLPSKKSTIDWASSLKKTFTQVRKQGINYLLSTEPIKILIEDLDLGRNSHVQCIRQLIDQQRIRDQRFEQYLFEDIKLLASSRKLPHKQKVLDRLAVLKIEPLSKENLNTIFHDLFHRQIKKQGMNKEVQEVIDLKVIKTLLICFQDLCHVYGGAGDKERLARGTGTAANTVIAVVKNLLSLPKRNSYISAENYEQYFMMHIWARLRQKNFTKKMEWQLENITDNALKVIFKYSNENTKDPGKNKWQQQFWLYTDKHVKPTKVAYLKHKIQQKFSNLVVFEQMLWEVLKLGNQYNCIDRNCLMVGRRGVGKKYTFQVSGILNNQNLEYSLSTAITKAIDGDRVIFYEQYKSKRSKQMNYQKLILCECDADLELLIEGNNRERYRESLSGTDGREDTRLLQKVKENISFVIAMDNKTAYDKLTYKFRNMAQWPVVQLHQWPKQALVGIANRKDQHSSVHAQIFLEANQIILDRQNTSMPIMKYQKYLETYQELLKFNSHDLEQQQKLYEQINLKFGQAALMVQNWERRVNILEIELKAIIDDMQNALRGNQLQSFVIATLSKQLTDQQAMLAQKNIDLQKTKTNAQFKMENMKKILGKIEKVVNSLQRSQLSELKKIYKTNNEIKFGLQCVCILLGEEETEKSINKLLADPHLHWKMKSHSLLEHRNQKYTNKFNKQFEKYQKIAINGHLETAKILYEWMKAIVEYWDVNEAYSVQSQDYQKLLTTYNESRIQFIKVKQTLKVMDAKLKKCVEDYQHYTAKKEQSQLELSRIEEKLKNVAIIIPILRKSQQQTKKIIKDSQRKRRNLEGNCILCAYSIIYLPLLKVTVKSRLLRSVKKVLTNYGIAFMDDFTNGLGNHSDSGWQAINMLALRHVKGSKIIIDPERRALPYILDRDEQLLNTIIERAQQIKDQEFDGKSTYHSAKQINVQKYQLPIDWKYTAFEPKQAIWNRIAEFKKPQYFQAQKTLALIIRRNMVKLDNMKKELYQKIQEKEIKILDDNQFIEIGRQLLELQNETEETRVRQSHQLLLIAMLSNQIEDQVIKIDTIYGHLRKIRLVSMQVMLSFACSEGDTCENVLRWALNQVQQQDRLGFLIACGLDIHYAKRLQNQELKNLLLDHTPFRQGEKPKTKKPTGISNSNWQFLTKLAIYGQNFMKFFDKAVINQKQFETWSNSSSLNVIPESFTQLQLSVLEKLVITKYFRHGSAQVKVMEKILSEIIPFNLNPFSADQIIARANPKYPILISCDYNYFLRINQKMNEGRVQRINLSEIQTQYEMKRTIWAAMEKKTWMVINGLYSEASQTMAQNIIYYVMNYDLQQSFRVFLYIDRTKAQRFITMAQQKVKNSRYISSIGVTIRNDELSVSKLFEIVGYDLQNNEMANDSFNKSMIRNSSPSLQNSPQNPPPVQITLYRIKLLTIVIHIVLQNRRKDFFELSQLYQALQIINQIQKNGIPLQFNIDNIAQSLGRVYSTSCPRAITRQVQDLFERLLDETKIHDRTIYGLPLQSTGNIDQNVKTMTLFTGTTDAELKRRDLLLIKNSFSVAFNLLFNQVDVKTRIIELRNVLVRLPNQINFNQDAQHQYLRLMYSQQLNKHNQRASELKQFVEWINIFSNKDENNDETDKELIFNWENLQDKISKLVGFSVSKNQIRTQLQRYVDFLKRQHDFFLYWKPSPSCFMIQPSMLQNFMKVLSSYKIAYFAKFNVTEAHLHILQPEFTNQFVEKDVRTQEGLLLSGMKLRQFKYHSESKSLEPSTDTSGQQRCPVILLKFKTKMKRADQQEYFMQIPIQICRARGLNMNKSNMFHKTRYGNSVYQFQNQIGVLKFNVEGCYPEWGLRNAKFLIE